MRSFFTSHYKFIVTNNKDGYVDYIIQSLNGDEIGIIQTVQTDANDIFIRLIKINPAFKRQGHATIVMDEMLSTFKPKSITICIATQSDEANAFWKSYLAKRKNSNIRGAIYRIHNN